MSLLSRIAVTFVSLTMVAAPALLTGCSDVTETGQTGQITNPTPDAVIDSGPQETPIEALTVDTGVSDDAPLAGETVDIVCMVEGLAEGQEPPATRWEVIETPDPLTHEVEISGNQIVFKTAGVYRVQCSITETLWADPTPAIITVEPGIASEIDTTVSPSTIGAGSTGTVVCDAQDEFGNDIVDGWELVIGPGGSNPGTVGGLVAAQMKVKGLDVGTYDVACRRGLGAVDPTPAVVTVEHGLPHRIVTTLDDEIIEAGGDTKVTCRAEDKQGNLVPDLPMTISLPDVVSLTGLNVGSTVAGTYVIRCVPAGLEWSAFVLEGANLQVTPGPPVTLDLALQPPKPFFALQELVTILVVAEDAYGNSVPDAEVEEFTVSPTTDYSATTLTTFLFKEEGTFTLSTALVNDPAVTNSIDVLINGEPPAITVTYPLRGATLSGTKPSVTVEGIAQDEIAGIAAVRVNGEPATLNPDGTFTKIIIPKWGLNIIELEAEDGGGTITTITQSFYYSDHWYPLTPAIPYVEDALKLWMSEDFIDDGVHNPTKPDDLATILEAVVADLDLSSLLGGGTEIGLGYELEINTISFNPPKLSLDPVFGGLDVGMEAKNLYVGLKLKGECKVLGVDLCPDFSGSVSVDNTLVTATLLASATAGVMDIDLTNEDVDMDHIDVDVNGILGWLFDWLIDFFVSIFSGQIEDLVKDQMADALGDTLAGLFSSLAISETIELPELLPGMPPSTLTFDMILWSLQFTPQGGNIGMAARAITAKATPHNIMGSIGRGTCLKGWPTAYDLPGNNEFEVGLYDDLLNELLAAIWYGGVLNLSLDEAALGDGFDLQGLPIDGLVVDTNPFLPPIINGCTEDGLITLQMGDFFVDVELDSILFGGKDSMGVYLFLEVEAELYLTETDEGPAIGIILHEIQTLKYHWEYVPELFVGAEDVLEGLINDQLIEPLLQDFIGQPLTEFPIPELSMSDLGGVLGGGGGDNGGPDIKIVPLLDALDRDGGHTVLKGQLE